MKELHKYISEELEDIKQIIEDFLISEGIEVDIDRNVTMTDSHEKLVDTSIENNPTVITSMIPNIEIYSIFKRKEEDVGDGNPLLYALKNEKGYKLTNINKVKNRIEYIVKEFFKKHGKRDITIMVPSTNKLNEYFAKVVASHCINPNYIGDIVAKMSIEEVDDSIFAEDSKFRHYYNRKFEAAYKQFKEYCRKMPGTAFRFHFIKDIQMRKVIEHTIKKNDKYWSNYIEAFNDKDLIIVDDSITLGNTIMETCKIVSECYTPKSITILTLMSPLYTENGKELANL